MPMKRMFSTRKVNRRIFPNIQQSFFISPQSPTRRLSCVLFRITHTTRDVHDDVSQDDTRRLLLLASIHGRTSCNPGLVRQSHHTESRRNQVTVYRLQLYGAEDRRYPERSFMTWISLSLVQSSVGCHKIGTL
jgi:hypothetical protein